MIVKGLSDRQKEALRRFLERLPDEPDADFDPDAPEPQPREVLADGLEFGGGRGGASASAEAVAVRAERMEDDGVLAQRARAFVAYATSLPSHHDRRIAKFLNQATEDLLDAVEDHNAEKSPPGR
jgi:hypothetical protein